MKKFLFTLLVALCVTPTISFAAFDDVTLTTDTVITAASINLNVSGSSAVVESIVVDANSFDVVLQSGSSITISSTDRRTFTVSPSSGVFTSSTGCDANQSTLTLSGTGSVTLTVTPTATTCTIPAGFGGGSSYVPSPLPGNPALRINNGATTTSKQDVTLLISASNASEMMISNDMSFSGASWEFYAATKNWRIIGNNGTNTVYVKFRNLNNVVSSVSSQGIVFENLGYVTIAPTASPSVALPPTVTTPVVMTTQTTYSASASTFTKNLQSGNSGTDVAVLQTFLEAKGFLIMPPGIPKGYFGPLTKAALVKYQKSVGLSGTGYFGQQTRAKMSAGDVVMPSSTPSSTMLSTRTFHRGLSLGMRGDDVMYLQQILNKDIDTQVASVGPGSSGNESTYFGSLTEKAVQRFQIKYGIVSSGTVQTNGFGAVGPKTLLKLREIENAAVIERQN